jgi:hypothetical protein
MHLNSLHPPCQPVQVGWRRELSYAANRAGYCSLLDKPLSNGTADAPAGAGNDGDPAV